MKIPVLVLEAISSLKESKGSTAKSITKYIEDGCSLSNSVLAPRVKAVLRKGLAFGAIAKAGRTRYRVGNVLKNYNVVAKRRRRRRGRKGRVPQPGIPRPRPKPR